MMTIDDESDIDADEIARNYELTTEEVMRAKAANPGMFVSAWEKDEKDIDMWSKRQVRLDARKRFIVAAENGDIEKVKALFNEANDAHSVSNNCVNEIKTIKEEEEVDINKNELSETVTVVTESEHNILDSGAQIELSNEGNIPNKDGDEKKKPLDINMIATVEKKQHTFQFIDLDKHLASGNIIEACHVSKNQFLIAADADGYTALHRAAYGGHDAVVKFLLSQGADVEARTVDGWTPLHSASFWSQFRCCKLLVEAGADYNAVTASNQTPLHLAASNYRASPFTIVYLLSLPGIGVFASGNGGAVCNAQGDSPARVIRRSTPLGHLLFPFLPGSTQIEAKDEASPDEID